MVQHARSLTTPAKSARAGEARAIYVSAAAFLLALIIALFVFYPDPQSLFGGTSIGLLASLIATVGAFIAFFLGNVGQYPMDATQTLFTRIRNIITKTALAFIHAAIVFLLTTAAFFIFSGAFKGLLLDFIASSFIVAAAVAMAVYVVYLAALQITSLRLSTALAIFLAAGVLSSMITAEDPYWWQLHFSSLGASDTRSSVAFNGTLIIAGMVIVALSDFIASDFARLKQVDERHRLDKSQTIRISLGIMGLFLAFVGIFVYNVYPFMHVASAGGMAIIFIGLTAMAPRIMPGFSKAFISLTYGLLAAILVSLWLYKGIGYFSLTTFELMCVGIIFAWLIVFIRQIAAGLENSELKKPARSRSRKSA